jgi:hypothetical protein
MRKVIKVKKKKKLINVRIEVDREAWAEIKAAATREERRVRDFAAEMLEKLAKKLKK